MVVSGHRLLQRRRPILRDRSLPSRPCGRRCTVSLQRAPLGDARRIYGVGRGARCRYAYGCRDSRRDGDLHVEEVRMKLPIYQVDAFTSRMFAGNPAAVVLLEEWLPDRVLAAIAAENNLAETAFVIPRGDVMPLRWFTPAVEVDLCGHATLATAHVLFRYLFPTADRVTFGTKSGDLPVKRDGVYLRLD